MTSIDDMRDRLDSIRDERHFPADMMAAHDAMVDLLDEIAALTRRAGGDPIPAGEDAAWSIYQQAQRDLGFSPKSRMGGLSERVTVHAIALALAYTPKPPAGGDAGAVERVAISQNDAMRQQLAHVGNLVSDLARAMKADQANDDGTWPDLAGRIQRLIAAALAPPAPVVEGDRWLHVKRGTVYEVIGYAELQNGNVKGLREGAELAVYRGEDGKLWARERGVFHDGRFAALSEGRSHG